MGCGGLKLTAPLRHPYTDTNVIYWEGVNMSTYHFDTTNATAVNLGNQAAPQSLTAIFNLVCPDTLRWWQRNHDDLITAVDAGQLQVHLKFWNKAKESLMNGNVAHGFIDYQHPQAALAFIEAVFEHQDDLRELAVDDVADYLQRTYRVTPYAQATAVQAAVDSDVIVNGVLTVPTLILDDQKYTGDSLPSLQPRLV